MASLLLIDDAADVFDALRANRKLAEHCAVRELELIARACDEYCVDTERADEAAEKLIRGGADGTAMVGEFLALELGPLLGVSAESAALLIAGVLDLRDRHPELWALVGAGGVLPWQALKVAARCSQAGLSLEAARWVDHQLACAAAGLPWARVVRSLEGLIVKADAELAAERALAKRQARRVFIGDHRDGGSVMFAQLDTEAALALARTVDRVAAALVAEGSTELVDQRRATALGVLADPRAALDLLAGVGDGRPTNRVATVVVHIAAEAVAGARILVPELGEGPVPELVEGQVARIERIGPLDTDTLRRFLAHSKVIVRPVIDLNGVPAVDSYEIPDRLRAHILARHPVEVFPYSGRLASGCDLDHTIRYDTLAPPGSRQTRAANLGPLSRRAHRAKTARQWRVEQQSPGEFLWTSRHGFRYLVTRHGTTALGRASS